MTPVIPLKSVARQTPEPGQREPVKPGNTSRIPPPQQDAILLLRSGGGSIATGLFCALLTKTVFGGIGPQGPHTNAGWLSLIITMMCLPFGSMLFALGAAKWFRNRR